MTNQQFEIYRAVVQCKTLPQILAATGLADHDALQDAAGLDALDFSDWNMDANTVITLTDAAMAQYEKRLRDDRERSFTRGIAVYGAVMSTVAIIAEIVLHFL